jgi:hypothetical protein
MLRLVDQACPASPFLTWLHRMLGPMELRSRGQLVARLWHHTP